MQSAWLMHAGTRKLRLAITKGMPSISWAYFGCCMMIEGESRGMSTAERSSLCRRRSVPGSDRLPTSLENEITDGPTVIRPAMPQATS